ncbi:hypothetical protein F4680DRAFT_429640 [Xylaria scruposa]|nr:hypothetical protein F4680DRAFT_429640 [Xylaria scruposa]
MHIWLLYSDVRDHTLLATPVSAPRASFYGETMVQIKLENSVAEFFELDDSPLPITPKIFISYNPISERNLATMLPRNTKYLIQQWRASGKDDLSPIINLILMPQRMSWVMGNMAVVFFKDGDEAFQGVEEDLLETLNVLNPASRFVPRFCTSIPHIQASVCDSLVIPYLPSDGLDNLLHHIDPNIHYELLSKRGLALSGLPTPRSEVLDFERPQHGWDSTALNGEITRTINAIRGMVPPFVLKSNSSGGSKGVYIIHTTSDQGDLERDIDSLHRSELSKLSPENAHLHPCTLILVEWLPGVAYCLNFYVQRDGTPRFVCCCEQNFSEAGHWLGGIITYSMQIGLASHFDQIIQKTASFLHSRGYRGPVGIDVMEDEARGHLVVDLNPRPTGSFVLGCLRHHFVEELGMDTSCVLPYMEFFATRTEFTTAFANELLQGSIIILAWWSDPRSSHSWVCVAVGSKERALLSTICERIVEWVRERNPH